LPGLVEGSRRLLNMGGDHRVEYDYAHLVGGAQLGRFRGLCCHLQIASAEGQVEIADSPNFRSRSVHRFSWCPRLLHRATPPGELVYQSKVEDQLHSGIADALRG